MPFGMGPRVEREDVNLRAMQTFPRKRKSSGGSARLWVSAFAGTSGNLNLDSSWSEQLPTLILSLSKDGAARAMAALRQAQGEVWQRNSETAPGRRP